MLLQILYALLVCEIVPAAVGDLTPNITNLGYRRNCCGETDVFTDTIQSTFPTTKTIEIPGKGKDWNITLTRVVITDLNDNHYAKVYVVGGGINQGFIKLKFVSPTFRGLTLHIIAFGYDSKYAYKDTERKMREGGLIPTAGMYTYHHW